MKCKIVNIAEGISEGRFECTKEQYDFLNNVLECQGNYSDEGYSGACYVDEVKEDGKSNNN